LFSAKQSATKMKTVYVYATTYYEEDINTVYNDVNDTLGKPNHYTIVLRDFNAHEQTLWKLANLG